VEVVGAGVVGAAVGSEVVGAVVTGDLVGSNVVVTSVVGSVTDAVGANVGPKPSDRRMNQSPL
jgi:hypothetical protein